MSIRAWSIVMLVLNVSGCAAGGVMDDRDVDALAQSVVGGQVPTAGSSVEEINVLVNTPNNLDCSGTLIRPHVTLTALHCADITNGTAGTGDDWPITNMSATQTVNGTATTFNYVSGVSTCAAAVGTPGTTACHGNQNDVLLMLTSGFTVFGSTIGHSMQLYNSSTSVINSTGHLAGYGFRTRNAMTGACSNTGIARTWDEPSGANNTNGPTFSSSSFGGDTNFFSINLAVPGAAGYRGAQSGDSGSSYTLRRNANHLYYNSQIVATHIKSFKDGGLCATTDAGLKASVFRNWAHQNLGNWDYDWGLGSFMAPEIVDSFILIDPPGAVDGPSNWFVHDSSDTLRDTTNIASHNTGWPGALAIIDEAAMSNGEITAVISSSDNDAAGVVFNYRDSANYQEFRIYQTTNGRAAGAYIITWSDGVATVNASKTLASFYPGFTWSSAKTVKVKFQNNVITGSVTGAASTVTATVSTYSAGRGGVVTWGLNPFILHSILVNPQAI